MIFKHTYSTIGFRCAKFLISSEGGIIKSFLYEKKNDTENLNICIKIILFYKLYLQKIKSLNLHTIFMFSFSEEKL